MSEKIYSFLVRFLARFFRPIQVPKEFLALEPELKSTILITQSDSIVIRALLLSLAFKIGVQEQHQLSRQNLEDLLTGKQSSIQPLSWASLHDLEKIKLNPSAENSDFKLTTFNVFQIKGPIRKWPSFRPSSIWLWSLIPTRRILSITIGKPFPLFQASTKRLVRHLKIDFIRTLKLVRGAPIEPRDEQLQSILASPECQRDLRILSERNGISADQGKALAKKAFYELAANPRRGMYDALSLVARLILGRLFSEVRTNGLDKLIPAIKDNTVVLVPMHRSHLDYVLVGYKLFSEKVNPPFVAAGINLSFWPFGFLFRSVGAYFVKRNARDRFHASMLKRYVHYLVHKGHLQEFFIEGGRSRSGKMLEPKLGILSTIVEAARSMRKKDILFVPVAITYENIVEDEVYGKENSGGSKVKETFLSTLKAFDIFKRHYGEAIIEFAKPISLNDFHAKLTAANVSERSLVQQLGYEICRGIRNQINPGMTSLAYSAILMTGHYGLKQEELKERLLRMHQTLELLKTCGFKVGTYTTQLQNFLDGNDEVLSDLASSDVLRKEEHFGDSYFFIQGNRRFTADYYRNSIIHYFFPISLLSLTELVWGSVDFSKTEILFKLFKEDLLLKPWDNYSLKLEKLCDGLCEKEVMIRETNNQFAFKDRNNFFPAMLASYMQAYLWVVKTLLASTPEMHSNTLLATKLIQKLINGAKAESYVGNITRTEATSRSTLGSVMNSLVARGLINISEGKESERTIRLVEDAETALKADLEVLSKVNYALNLFLLNQERA